MNIKLVLWLQQINLRIIINYICCSYKNSSTFSINTALWHGLGKNKLDFSNEDSSTPWGINQGICYVRMYGGLISGGQYQVFLEILHYPLHFNHETQLHQY